LNSMIEKINRREVKLFRLDITKVLAQSKAYARVFHRKIANLDSKDIRSSVKILTRL